MNLATLGLPDLIGSILAFIFTLLVFSYVFGDNFLFRLAVHIFIGVASGYAVVVAWYNVIWPQLLLPLIAGSQLERIYVVVPLILAGLLLFKISPSLSRAGNLPVAYLVGAGMGTAVGGVVMGTLFPQIAASINLLDLKSSGGALAPLGMGLLILLGTVTTLIYFHFGASSSPGQPPQRREWIDSLGWVGQIFVAITLGFLFAGVYSAALTALIERIHFFGDLVLPLLMTR
jgi:hypothetical protein